MLRSLRRAVLAVASTAVIAGVVRLRGRGHAPPPPRQGGWRDLRADELR